MKLWVEEQSKKAVACSKEKTIIRECEPLVSVVVPTYNEEKDIRQTLDALVKLHYTNKEVIVVDDSMDRTPEIVQEYANYGIRLIHRESGERGRCSARNLGITEAKGEVVVILNADVLLPYDFIDRILVHYHNGADVVLVESKVTNDEYLFPRFVQALYHYSYDGQNRIDQNEFEWTEGFSCRRQAAIDVGLFPANFPLPLVAGEDGFFGKKLAQKYKKIIDRSIVVHHIAPHTLKDYWKARKEKGSPLVKFFLQRYSLLKLSLWLAYKTFYFICRNIFVFPALIESHRISRFSQRRMKDLIPLFYAYYLQQTALLVGNWHGVLLIAKGILSRRITEYRLI